MPSRKTHIQLILLLAMLSGLAAITAGATGAPRIAALGQLRDGLVSPTRVAVDGQGNFYVLDARGKAVFKYDKYGEKSGGVQVFNAVSATGGLAVTADGARLLIADRKSAAVIDGATGALLGYLGGENRFGQICDIDIDDNGYVFVADASRLRIEVFRPDRKSSATYVYDYQFGVKGIEAGQFMGIAAMDIHGEAGEVYVADPFFYKPEGAAANLSAPKVQVYDLAGNLKKAAGGTADFILPGSKAFGAREMIYFGGMTFDDQGRGYFTDSYNGRINVLDLRGADPLKMYLSSYAVAGYGEGQLSDPRDLAYDAVTGRLLVVCGDGRIEILGVDGATNPVSVNRAPATPEPTGPVGRSEVPLTTPSLRWRASWDPDGDAVTYRVKIGEKGTDPRSYDNISTTSLILPDALEENACYAWSVQAADGETASAWADTQEFCVNAVAEAPTMPLPLTPQAGASVDGRSLFTWRAVSDPDPLDSLGYLFQVASDLSFTKVVLEEKLEGTSLALGDNADYPLLEDGKSYFWRVKAIDATGLESPDGQPLAFVYDVVTLKVTANVSGARVYLGGNLGFPGQRAGETPLELRDVPAGRCSIVVENAGFEPAVAQVEIVEKVGASAHLTLLPALNPDKFARGAPVRAASGRLRIGSDSAPFLADYDNDGLADLLVGGAAGGVVLYRGDAAGPVRFAAGEALALPTLVPGATPFLADWNNDLRKDLLVGADDGTVMLFLNSGTEQAPVFAEGTPLAGQDGVLDVGDGAVPVVTDLDGDGRKDLILGSSGGVVAYYRNVGADGNPELVHSADLVSPQAIAPSAPFVLDWNGDGRRDLLVDMKGRLYAFPRQDDGAFAEAAPIELPARSGGGTPHVFFAADLNGAKGKDWLIGGSDGEVHFLGGLGKTLAPAFGRVMLEKIAGLAESLGTGSNLKATLAVVESAVRGGNYRSAAKKMKTLVTAFAGDREKAARIEELSALLTLAGKAQP